MKQNNIFKNFLISVFVIAFFSTLISSCSMESKLGNSGCKVTVGASAETKSAAVCIVCELENAKNKTVDYLENHFPKLKGKLDFAK